MDQQTEIATDVATIKQALVDIAAAEAETANDFGIIANDITALKNQVNSGQDQSATVAALDDLATRAAAAATSSKANAAAADAIANPPASTSTGTGTGTGTDTGTGGTGGDASGSGAAGGTQTQQ